MKKCLTVLLMFCLLMTIHAAVLADRIVYQDEEAPEMLMVSDDLGGSAAAVIRGIEGDVIATIPTDETIKLVCVSDRELESDANVASLLEKGLKSLMEEEHYSRGFWTVDTDLFYVEIPEKYEEHFSDGNAKLEMVFDPIILDEGEKLTVLASTDGENWSEVKDVAFKENGSVQVAIQETCLLAFLIEHGAAVEDGFGGMGISVGDRDVPEEGNQNFTPSVSGKLAPEVVVIEKDGEKYVASILDGNGNASALVPDDAWMIVTPLSERKYNPDVVTYEHLQWAYDTICEAPNIGGLPDADHDSTLGDVIDRMLEEMGKGLSRKDLTVSDLFEISVYGDYQQMLADGNMLEITVDRELDPEDTLIVLCASDIEYWHVVDRENVIIHEDGTVTLRLRHTGAFVFLVERPAEEIDPEAADTVKAP